MTERVRVLALSDLPPGTSREVVVRDRIVALFNVDGDVYALDGICPHAGGPLGAGRLEGGLVTCPWHGWQFDVKTGRHSLTERICQPSFPVTVEGDQIYVTLS